MENLLIVFLASFVVAFALNVSITLMLTGLGVCFEMAKKIAVIPAMLLTFVVVRLLGLY